MNRIGQVGQVGQVDQMDKMHRAFHVRRQRWHAIKRRRPLALEALLGGIGAIVILLLITAGICASLMRRS